MNEKHPSKISTEQLCLDYFDSQIFSSSSVFELRVYADILKADRSAKGTNADIFICELDALGIELFGLAWLNHNYELSTTKKQGQGQFDTAICAEIKFTSSYLKEAGQGNIWSAMGFYNDTMFKASLTQQISTDWSVPRDTGYYARDVHLPADTSDNMIDKGTREHYRKLLADAECASRLANRILSINAWRAGIMIPQRLSSAFAQRLNFSPNIEALVLLQRLVFGIYDNAKNYIHAVNEYGSWESARKAQEGLRQLLIKWAQEHIEKRSKNGNIEQL